MVLVLMSCSLFFSEEAEPVPYVLVVHGGAGFLSPDTPPERQREYRDALTQALRAGEEVLSSGGASLDAVEAAIRLLEDSPLFNAGKGAVFTADGLNELDASIMEGSSHQAGAVAGVRTVRHPITAAKAVMNESPHVMLAGRGAEAFAEEMGLELVDPEWFRTDESWQGYLKQVEKIMQDTAKFGTVGAVALDRHGNLAAGTSTGGMSMKRYGRIGDSPVIGAGTWADNATCAISCTGHGEYFIRYGAAHEVSARMEHRKWTMERAAGYVINDLFRKIDASGGLIGVDCYGNITMPFNTTSMFRGFVREGEDPEVLLFAE